MLVIPENVETLAATLARTGRVRVPSVLEPSAADALAHCLDTEVPWQLAYYDARRQGKASAVKLDREAVGRLTPAEAAALTREIHRQARAGFQYVYQAFDLLDGFRRGIAPGLFAYKVMQSLAGDACFRFLQALTGDSDIDHIDGHATCFTAGHFLKCHADESPWERRRYAYVLSVTRHWTVDMGGLLQFLDETGQVTETLVPAWNALTVFRVPVEHSVTMVPAWVTGKRLSVTGWLTVSG